jgi:hypothetical protein
MKILAIRYVPSSSRLVEFYKALGFDVDVSSRTGDWIEFVSAPAVIAIHTLPSGDSSRMPGGTELAFEAEEPLESVKARLDRAGFAGAAIVDESHGRSLQILDPEGSFVQINEFDRELYV